MAKDIMTSGIEMSDVIKTTGFPVPEDMEGKTFAECVSVESIVAEPLAVTENGVYTAPSGKAYSSVTVNVPSGATDLIFNVKCTSLSNDYLMSVTFPRSNKVTDIAIDGDFSEHYSYNENGYISIERASKAGMKVSVVYDGDTYSYTYTGRDYERHDLIKE